MKHIYVCCLCVCVFQYVDDNLAVMSIGFLLSSPDDAVIWRGPKKNGVYLFMFSANVYFCLDKLESLCPISAIYHQTNHEGFFYQSCTVGCEK